MYLLAGLAAVLLVPAGLGHAAPALPDLVPLPPSHVQLGPADGAPFGADPSVIRFTTSILNRGEGALDILGVPTEVDRALALQCVAFVVRACLEREEVGYLTFHAYHQHWHIEEFARYELLPLAPDGTPDFEAEPLALSDKVSFCLMDTGPDPEAGEQDTLDNARLYRTCTGALQGISPGWMDAYGYGLWGQQLDHTGVPDGSYAIVITANPLGLLSESDMTNNVAFTPITIEEGGTIVRAL